MASVDGQGHLLSLKVMRVSRPGLASVWEPFYSNSSSFSARSTASILSLQGRTPLPGHPKTLRDLTHVSEFLTLPVAFGAIQLGETFSSCLSVNNEANMDVEGVSIKVEMQTANAKVLLAEVGGADGKVAVGDSLEVIVYHEVKELGQHVLACTVNYRLPNGFRHAPGSAEGTNDPALQGFCKYYKFVVTNPLSVKTKVNIPRSPSALLDPVEREKVFLEVHIQNTTPEPMWFARIYFECADGWTAIDMNHLSGTATSNENPQLFSGSMALLQPQAIRQYIYVLSPTAVPTFPVPPQPGSSIPLGRLDIVWRTQFGEPGRLLTSMLSRRVPGPPPPPSSVIQQPPSAIPPYLQRGGTPSSSPRAHSAQLPPSRPTSPSPVPHRPNSPFRNRPTPIPRAQSPAGSISSPLQSARPLIGTDQTPDIQVDLIVTQSASKLICVGEPFKMGFRLTVSAAIPKGTQHQTVSIVVQHLQPPRVPVAPASPLAVIVNPHREPHTSHVKGIQASHRTSTDYALVASPSTIVNNEGDTPLSLPPPYFETVDQERDTKLKGCDFLGPSAIVLDPIQLIPLGSGDDQPITTEGSQQFELTFLPLQTGYICVGGLRILLVDHELTDVERGVHHAVKEPKTLKVHDVIGEIWVRS